MDVEAVGDALGAMPAAAGKMTSVSDAELGETGKPGTEGAANPA